MISEKGNSRETMKNKILMKKMRRDTNHCNDDLETLYENLDQMARTHEEEEKQWKDRTDTLEKHVLELKGQLTKVHEECRYLDRDRNQQLAMVEHDLIKRTNDLDKYVSDHIVCIEK
jgi:uncharacterized phage infection (PIP) family protein YhgE